jgi:hypothetical protein
VVSRSRSLHKLKLPASLSDFVILDATPSIVPSSAVTGLSNSHIRCVCDDASGRYTKYHLASFYTKITGSKILSKTINGFGFGFGSRPEGCKAAPTPRPCLMLKPSHLSLGLQVNTSRGTALSSGLHLRNIAECTDRVHCCTRYLGSDR